MNASLATAKIETPFPKQIAVRQIDRPHIVMVVARGEAVRNFLYSDTLRVLGETARVTLLSVIEDEAVNERFRPYVEQIVPLRAYTENQLVSGFRHLLHMAHFRWLWSEAVKKHHWPLHDARARTIPDKIKRMALKGVVRAIANRPMLEGLTGVDRLLSWHLRPTDDFLNLFKTLKPDLVLNCSHIHGPLGDLPLRIAHRMGIPTAAFIFSWDNLTSRSRIFVPYDYYMVWNDRMREHLLRLYPAIQPDHVFVTGTPQFDFHFKREFWLTREELCQRVGLDPRRPYVLYTTGVADHFPEEHRTVELVIRLLNDIDLNPGPQLLVRTYIKGTSPEMKALASLNLPGVVFPPVLWEKESLMPLYEDLFIYTNLLRHASMGINAASTVSLELMMHDKPVINLGFDPPGSNLPDYSHFATHIELDHYLPVAQSGGVMVARSVEDMRTMLVRGLAQPRDDSEKRCRFIRSMFGETLDGESGRRVAERLVEIGKQNRHSAT
jgi:hypothetical protein